MPSVLECLVDTSSLVRTMAIRVLTALVATLHACASFTDAPSFFPHYLFPALVALPADPAEIVRVAFASSLASLASTAREFLDLSHHQRHMSDSVSSPALKETRLSFDTELHVRVCDVCTEFDSMLELD